MSDIKNFNTTSTASEQLHAPFAPIDIRENEQLRAYISYENKEYKCKVWRFSPLGLEFEIPGDSLKFEKNNEIDLKIFIGIEASSLKGIIVDKIEKNNKFFYYSRLIAKNESRYDNTDRRKNSRWLCSQQFYPTAVASNPAKFNDFIYFKVKDISYTGFRLITSLRNKFIIPGMNFECLVNFPMVSQIRMNLKVSNISIDLESGREVLSIGATYSSQDKKISEVVGNYLFQFSNVQSAKELKEEGFNIRTVSDVVEYSYVRTKEEYDQVLELRLIAYKLANKINKDATKDEMADEYDSRSRIVIGKYRGQVVSSARLIYNEFEDTMEQEKYVSWPEDQPRRDEMVEIMRACTHPDFRSTDLLISLFKFIAVSVMQSKREYAVLCATDEMSALYEKIGFYKINLSYEHPKLNNIVHHVFLGNVPKAMAGVGVNPIYWNIIWSDVTHYLEKHDLLEMDPILKIRHFIYGLFKPISKLVFRSFRKGKPVSRKNQISRNSQEDVSKRIA